MISIDERLTEQEAAKKYPWVVRSSGQMVNGYENTMRYETEAEAEKWAQEAARRGAVVFIYKLAAIVQSTTETNRIPFSA